MRVRVAAITVALCTLVGVATAPAVITVEGIWMDTYPGLGITAGNTFRVTYGYELASYVGSDVGGLGETRHAWTRAVDPGQEIEGDPISQQGNTRIIELDVDVANAGSPVYQRVKSADVNGDTIPDGAPSGPLRLSVDDENGVLGGDWLQVRDSLTLGSLGNKDAVLMPLDWIFHQYFTDNAFELAPPTQEELIAALNTVKNDPQALVPGASNLAFALGGVTPGSQPGTGDVWGYVTSVVPEPGTMTLVSLAGGLGLLARRRHR